MPQRFRYEVKDALSRCRLCEEKELEEDSADCLRSRRSRTEVQRGLSREYQERGLPSVFLRSTPGVNESVLEFLPSFKTSEAIFFRFFFDYDTRRGNSISPQGTDMDFKRIVVTTDFSDDSHRAFELAAYEAKMQKSQIYLVTVLNDWDVPPVFLHDIANPEAIVQYRDQIKAKADQTLKEYAKTYFHDQAVTTHVISSIESPADALSHFANEKQANLMVMSSHGRGALGQFFLGSVVQRVLRSAPCPVLVIPKPHE